MGIVRWVDMYHQGDWADWDTMAVIMFLDFTRRSSAFEQKLQREYEALLLFVRNDIVASEWLHSFSILWNKTSPRRLKLPQLNASFISWTMVFESRR